ncbi:heat-shock protein Hsp20 [Pilimelia anulata]|uniref:Heat-shock protein Hsp20 n=1 Tax=Pilimelia anulata TaxID=53371 RepID=A0A8J3BKJ9_9ACTN|nr:Hsp20/alpha crystallin family protein [Pilimelia anulata]GGK10522.1 heat-shock protein Hsp20 [Pilimelia anulata]
MVLRFDPFRDLDRLTGQFLAEGRRVPLAMPTDLYRSGDRYVLQCDLAGVDPGSVDVNVDGGTLTISARRTGQADDVQWLRQERSIGTFQRQFSLGDGLDLDRIDASYDDGVLTVTIPLAERAKPRQVPIGGAGRSRVLEPAG